MASPSTTRASTHPVTDPPLPGASSMLVRPDHAGVDRHDPVDLPEGTIRQLSSTNHTSIIGNTTTTDPQDTPWAAAERAVTGRRHRADRQHPPGEGRTWDITVRSPAIGTGVRVRLLLPRRPRRAGGRRPRRVRRGRAASRKQLVPGLLGECLESHLVQLFVGCPEVIAGVRATSLATQPFAVQEVGAGDLDPEWSSAEVPDRSQ
jgi:hypothetical protein